MSKFNNKGAKSAGPKSVMTTTKTTKTYEGGDAYERDAKSELMLLAATNMVGEDTFYEAAKQRDDRFSALVHQVVLEDPGWAYRMLGWLRNVANMRSASIVMGAECLRARLDAGVHELFYIPEMGYKDWYGSKDFIPHAMARGDELGEMVAYWTSKYGKKFPMPFKRGMVLACETLVTEYSYLKYGRAKNQGEWDMGDIVNMFRPAPGGPRQSALYKHMLEVRHGGDTEIPAELTMLTQRKQITGSLTEKGVKALLTTEEGQERLKAAGMTWEALSGSYGALDAVFWESLIFSGQLGYMAMLRNLRNFEKAGISKKARKAVQERLSDPEQVKRSRQFPYRFLSAYRNVESDWWGETLSDALDASMAALPRFRGRTAVMIDLSASMQQPISQRSKVSHLDIAALMGAAMTEASGADLYAFATGMCEIHVPLRQSVMKTVNELHSRVGQIGHGTNLVPALKAVKDQDDYDRVVLVTDFQAFAADPEFSWNGTPVNRKPMSRTVTGVFPESTVMIGINPLGYTSTGLDLSQRNRYEVGGFSDQIFRMIKMLEDGDGGWPF